MYDHLSGELVRKSPTEAVVDVNGVGYLLSISAQCFTALPASGRVKLFVHVHHSKDVGTRLFGFLAESERVFFRLLQSVRGVGPAIALTLLSHETPSQLAKRIASKDVAGLKRIKGVGTKTAERLVFELEDEDDLVTTIDGEIGDHLDELERALASLGLDRSEAAVRARATTKSLPQEKRIEVLLRAALQARAAGGR